MRIHCLGTVGYHPNDDRHTSCYFLPESGILLDAGTGLFRVTPLIQTKTLHVLLSHAHLDHTFGLTFLLDVLFQQPVDELTIWGEPDKLHAVRTHLFSELIFPAPLDCEFREITVGKSFEIGDVTIDQRPQNHPGGSIAFRLDWKRAKKRLVYATDTTGDLTDEHAKWSSDSDLLMHECYFRDDASEWALKTGHSWTGRVADVAAKSNPAKLLLTHINPLEHDTDPIDIEVIRSRIDGEVLLAEDGMVVDF